MKVDQQRIYDCPWANVGFQACTLADKAIAAKEGRE
jgi:hypothetical protein